MDGSRRGHRRVLHQIHLGQLSPSPNSLPPQEWLRGLYLQDPSVNTHELTNAQLAAILDPTSDR